MKSTFLTTTFILFSLLAYGQNNYESLSLQLKFDKIFELSKELESQDDFYWHSIVLDRSGQTMQAISVLDSGLMVYPNSEKLNILLGDFLFKTGQYTKCQPIFQDQTDDASCFLKLMKVYEFSDDYYSIIDSILPRIATDSTNISHLSILANAYRKVDSTQIAIHTYEKIVELNPNDLITSNRLALTLFNSNTKQNTVKTIAVCQQILTIDSTLKRIYKLKGTAHFKLEDYRGALACYQYVYEHGDSSFAVLKQLGICEYQMFEYDSSVEKLLMAHQIDSTDMQVCLFLGQSLEELSRASEALSYLSKVDSLLKAPEDLLLVLLWEKQKCYSRLKRHADVIFCLTEMRKYDPNPAYIFYIASNYENGMQQPKVALKYYNEFLAELEENGDMYETNKGGGASLESIAKERVQKIKEELFWEEGNTKQN